MAFNALTMDELCARLCENKMTLIVYHVRSDADAVGSAFALREILRLMGIPSFCVCSDEVPERLRFLSEDAQGSVVIDEDMDLGHERVISVDSALGSQLGGMFDRLRKDIDLMIDHHSVGTPYADNYIDTDASATGEIIYAIADKLLVEGKIPMITPYALKCIYAAISSDTGCFRYSNVTPATHRIAAELIEMGVDAADINHRLFSCKSAKQMAAEGEAARRLTYHLGGRVASVTMPYSVINELDLKDEHLDTVIEIPRSVEGVEVAFAIRQTENKPLFKVSMRSASEVDVAAICKSFGGGGHVKAAGCSLEASSIDEAEAIIANAISKSINR